VNDVVVDSYVNSPIQIFSWGELTNELTGTIAGGSQSAVILSENLSQTRVNFYIGCILLLYQGGNPIEFSYIDSYDPNTNTVTLETPFTNNVTLNDDIKIRYPDSLVNPYILQVVGYDSGNIFEYSSLFLYNYTRRWIRKISQISNLGLVNLVDPIPVDQYSTMDILELRTSLQALQYPLTHYYNSIVKYAIVVGSHRYKVGSRVFVKPDTPTGVDQIFRVMSTNECTDLVLEIEQFGGPFGSNSVYVIYDTEDPSANPSTLAELTVLQSRTVIDAGTNAIPSPEQNVLYIGQTLLDEFFYFNYVVDKQRYLILLDDVPPYMMIIDPTDPVQKEYGFLQKKDVQCSMNVPNFSFSENQVCMNVQLEYLILPNRRVKGYNQLLSFFPYVIVRLYNIESSQYSRYGNIVSNNQTSTNSQFICPIGNLLNPLIIKFVEVKSDGIQTLKLSPYQDLFFEVLLPNGNLLEFEEDYFSVSSLVRSFNFTIRDTVACIFSFSV
jgi:hypothetical protein